MTKAVIFDQFGVANLKIADRPAPEPGPDHVKIRVSHVSLNYRDLLMVQGKYNPRLSLPLIPCSDGAGTVSAVGTNVAGLRIGDRVCSTMLPDWEDGQPGFHLLKSTLGGPMDGLLSEERTLPANAVLKLPDGIGWEEAACLPVAGLTAWSSLVTVARTRPGERVLLLGTGGVSIMGLHIAKRLGAEVAVTSSSDKKLEKAALLGADHLINYKQHTNWARRILEILPHGVDTVLEVGGDGTFDQSVHATRPGGTVALIGVLAQKNKPVDLTRVLMKRIRVQGILVGSRAEFRDYIDFVGKHPHGAIVDEVFVGLENAGKAFSYMAAGGHLGKIVIRIAP